MRGYDIWHKEREAAEVIDFGLRVHREEHQGRNGMLYLAKVWMPNALKPLGYYSFRTLEAREQYIVSVVRNVAEHHRIRDERKAAEKAGAEKAAEVVQPGHIFVYSWGYDQTNVEYFQVTEKHGQMVTIRRIASSSVPDSAGFMSNRVEPRIGHFLEDAKPLRKRLQSFGDRPHLSFEFGSCELWRGGSHYQSWYA